MQEFQDRTSNAKMWHWTSCLKNNKKLFLKLVIQALPCYFSVMFNIICLLADGLFKPESRYNNGSA